jgi:hypothetical protein
MAETEDITGSGFSWSFLKAPIQWVIKKACEDWIKGIVESTVKEEKEGIISSSIVVQKLKTYDEVYDDMSKNLSYAIGRYFEHQADPKKYPETHVMKKVNEVRQARLRFLKNCGTKIRTYLLHEGTDWLDSPGSFIAKAREIEDVLGKLVADDRKHVEKSIDV